MGNDYAEAYSNLRKQNLVCSYDDYKNWFTLRVVRSGGDDNRPLKSFGLYATRNRELTMDDLGVVKSRGYDVLFSVFINTGSEPKIDHRFNYFYILV